MRFDRRAIERQRHAILAGLGQGIEDREPTVTFGPSIEAIVDGRVRAIFARAIAPTRATLEHMNDAADNAPVILTLRPCEVGGKMRLNAGPLSVVQPKQITLHHFPRAESTRHKGIIND
jgi:hypothetical protein